VNKTKIEWVKNPDGSQGYTHNPMSGCKNHTPEGLCLGGLFPCYAWKLAHTRLKQRYLANGLLAPIQQDGLWHYPQGEIAKEIRFDPFYPRFWENRLQELERRIESLDRHRYIGQKPMGIFPCDMGDLFGIGIPEEWTRRILDATKRNAYDRFYLLTKQPQNLIKFSPFPDNCWVGVTATNTEMFLRACTLLEYPLQAKVKYLSLEPLLSWSFNWNASYLVNTLERAEISWLIIGACTGTKKDMEELCKRYPNLTLIYWKGNLWTAQPRIEDLREIVEAADKAGIKVFLKDNLEPLLDNELTIAERESHRIGMPGNIRQEMPPIPSE